jgi:hypothetical protein
VHFKKITLGRIMDGYIEVRQGVTREDRIVQTPSAALLEGDKVRIVEPARGYEDKTLPPGANDQPAKKGDRGADKNKAPE